MKEVEGVVDPNVRGFWTQGTLRAGGPIPTSTVSSRQEGFHRISPAGCTLAMRFFCP